MAFSGSAVALSFCAQEVRSYDHDRFLTGLFVPADRREALFALLAFNLEIAKTRELVREPLMGQIRLQWWRDTIATLYQPGAAVPGHEVVRPLRDAIARHPLSRRHFDALIDAREADLDEAGPASQTELLAYAEATAVPVIELALELLGLAEWSAAGATAAVAAGRHVGIAWALIGLLRAVPFHRQQRRVMLPVDLLARHGLSPGQLLDRLPEPKVLAPVVAEVAALAREHLSRARQQATAVPAAALPALLPASLADLHLGTLRRTGYNPFAPSVQARHPLRAARLVWCSWRQRW